MNSLRKKVMLHLDQSLDHGLCPVQSNLYFILTKHLHFTTCRSQGRLILVETKFEFRSRDSRSSRGGRSRNGGSSKYSSRDDPEPSKCLGVFGLSLYTTERDLRDLFSQYGDIDKVQLVFDRPTGRSRGFGFIYFDKLEDAVKAKEKLTGSEVDGHKVRVDYSVTKRAHTPTPGIYMGTPSQTRGGGGYRRPSYRYDYRRSPSPYRGSYRSGRSPRYRGSYYDSMRFVSFITDCA
ncbi:unnamed protein product [Anisakis simplex]|uniref:RRM domain-containing protein n=1 Tax=Anisakis simplex TaxID=6269 RepID=A0A0M3JYR8_ANISI|nr:unnamed protein product [Anisakis simplex]